MVSAFLISNATFEGNIGWFLVYLRVRMTHK